MQETDLLKLLYGTLSAYQASAFDCAIKTNGALIVVIGWIITSDKAREFLVGRRYTGALAGSLLALCSGLYGVFTWRTRVASVQVAEQISLLKLLDRAVYDHAILSMSGAVMLIIGNASITLVAIVLVLLASKSVPACYVGPPAP